MKEGDVRSLGHERRDITPDARKLVTIEVKAEGECTQISIENDLLQTTFLECIIGATEYSNKTVADF